VIRNNPAHDVTNPAGTVWPNGKPVAGPAPDHLAVQRAHRFIAKGWVIRPSAQSVPPAVLAAFGRRSPGSPELAAALHSLLGDS
jgi:hypothetical protein